MASLVNQAKQWTQSRSSWHNAAQTGADQTWGPSGLRHGHEDSSESRAEESTGCAATARLQLRQLSGVKAEASWWEDTAEPDCWCPGGRVRTGTTQGTVNTIAPNAFPRDAPSPRCTLSPPGQTRARSCNTTFVNQGFPLPIALAYVFSKLGNTIKGFGLTTSFLLHFVSLKAINKLTEIVTMSTHRKINSHTHKKMTSAGR